MSRGKRIEPLITAELGQYGDELDEVVFACMSMAMKQCKRDIKANCLPGWKEYKGGWTIRTKRLKFGFEGVVYNKTKPTLTHLLEKSHIIRNQYGQYGRTSEGHGQHVHIAPAAEDAQGYFVDLIVQRVSEI